MTGAPGPRACPTPWRRPQACPRGPDRLRRPSIPGWYARRPEPLQAGCRSRRGGSGGDRANGSRGDTRSAVSGVGVLTGRPPTISLAVGGGAQNGPGPRPRRRRPGQAYQSRPRPVAAPAGLGGLSPASAPRGPPHGRLSAGAAPQFRPAAPAPAGRPPQSPLWPVGRRGRLGQARQRPDRLEAPSPEHGGPGLPSARTVVAATAGRALGASDPRARPAGGTRSCSAETTPAPARTEAPHGDVGGLSRARSSRASHSGGRTVPTVPTVPRSLQAAVFRGRSGRSGGRSGTVDRPNRPRENAAPAAARDGGDGRDGCPPTLTAGGNRRLRCRPGPPTPLRANRGLIRCGRNPHPSRGSPGCSRFGTAFGESIR
jgi:hypothetical protein